MSRFKNIQSAGQIQVSNRKSLTRNRQAINTVQLSAFFKSPRMGSCVSNPTSTRAKLKWRISQAKRATMNTRENLPGQRTGLRIKAWR